MLNLLHIQPPSLQVGPNTVRYSAFDAEISISIAVRQIRRLIETYEEQLHIIIILMIHRAKALSSQECSTWVEMNYSSWKLQEHASSSFPGL